MHNLYKSRIPSCFYVFKNGKQGFFVDGRYNTGLSKEIEELDEEILSGHPHIYVDKDEAQVDTDALDPMEVVRKKAVADYIAAQKKVTDPTNDMGSTEQSGKLQGIANTHTISAGAADSSSGQASPVAADMSVRLSAIKVGTGE